MKTGQERLSALTKRKQEHTQVTSVNRRLNTLPGDDRGASHGVMQQFYPHVYRYLLYLIGNPETAADLTQETFVHAWRSLKTFEGRVPIQHWLYRIAYREFLQELRRRRTEISLDRIPEPPISSSVAWTDAAELRTVLGSLPAQERDVLILHYFEGYDYQEISGIIGASVGRVRHRLSEARARLRQEIGEGDLGYVNRPFITALRRWAWLPLEALADLEACLPLEGEKQEIAPSRDAEIIDARLDCKVHVQVKGVALGDLCHDLQEETGIGLRAAPSIADEKATLFCRDQSLRAVMRALSSLFGFTWQRNCTAGVYRYELVQERQAQRLEEALRMRDHHAALLALDSEMQRYRRYLALSREEARSAASLAGPENRPLLENLAGPGWAAVQMYFRLPPVALAALHAGQVLIFSPHPTCGQWPLPEEVEQALLASLPPCRIPQGLSDQPQRATLQVSSYSLSSTRIVQIDLSLSRTEPGQARLEGGVVFTGRQPGKDPEDNSVVHVRDRCVLAVGISQSLQHRGKAMVASPLVGDATGQKRTTVAPKAPGLLRTEDPEVVVPGITTADVLEALHHATGYNFLGDYFTRFYPPETVTLCNVPLEEALSHLSEAMRVRWHRDEDWLLCRTAGFLHDRLAEVPARLLSCWAATRREQGILPLEDLIEIANLSDAQLDAPGMAEGAQTLYGLEEWPLVRSPFLRPHWRFLGSLPQDLRREAWSEEGLRWERLPEGDQQHFLALATYTPEEERHPYDLAFAALRDVLAHRGQGTALWRPQDMAGATLHVVSITPGARPDLSPPRALPADSEAGKSAPGNRKEIAFIYRYGSVQTGFWRREVRSQGTGWKHDASKPLSLNRT